MLLLTWYVAIVSGHEWNSNNQQLCWLYTLYYHTLINEHPVSNNNVKSAYTIAFPARSMVNISIVVSRPYITVIRWKCRNNQYLASWCMAACITTVYPKKYAHGFVVLCFVVVMQSFIMNSQEVFIHMHQGCFAGTGAIVRLPQGQWSKPDGYGKISQCMTTTKHSKAQTVCIFLRTYCTTWDCHQY